MISSPLMADVLQDLRDRLYRSNHELYMFRWFGGGHESVVDQMKSYCGPGKVYLEADIKLWSGTRSIYEGAIGIGLNQIELTKYRLATGDIRPALDWLSMLVRLDELIIDRDKGDISIAIAAKEDFDGWLREMNNAGFIAP